MAHPTKIAVCGMPRSGNRLVQRLLQRHGFEAEVRHFGHPKAFRTGGGPDRAVIPLRAVEPHWLSCERDLALLPAIENDLARTIEGPIDLHFVHFFPTLSRLAELSVPVLPVSYEALVADPDGHGRRIVEFAAAGPIHWLGWGEAVFDGNAKWKEEVEP